MRVVLIVAHSGLPDNKVLVFSTGAYLAIWWQEGVLHTSMHSASAEATWSADFWSQRGWDHIIQIGGSR